MLVVFYCIFLGVKISDVLLLCFPKNFEGWVLGIECWVLDVGYTVIFPMPSQAKKYECWVLGIGY